MTVSRRRLLQSLALTGVGNPAVEGAEPAIALDVLRNVSAAHGANLSDDRLRVASPVLERRLPQLRAFREVEIEDTVTPTQGILDK